MAQNEATTGATITVRPAELAQLLKATMTAGLNTLVIGAPGVGKSDVIYQVAQALGYGLIRTDASNADTTVATGLPWFTAGESHADFKPYGDLHRALSATERTVWLIEELGQATPMVQAAFMPLLSPQRKTGLRSLPDCVSFVATSNKVTHRAGVHAMLEPVKSRFATIVEVTPDLDDWVNWYFKAFGDSGTEVPAFLRFKPALLSDFQPSANMTNSPSPRTWAAVGRLLQLGLPAALEYAAIVGAVGEGAAGEFVAFQRTWRALPNLDAILLDPKNAPIPDEPSALYAVAVGLAARCTVANFGRLVEYGERLAAAYHGDIGVLMLQDSQRRTPAITQTKAYQLMAAGPLGKLITG